VGDDKGHGLAASGFDKVRANEELVVAKIEVAISLGRSLGTVATTVEKQVVGWESFLRGAFRGGQAVVIAESFEYFYDALSL
jgi:hypothetical protein